MKLGSDPQGPHAVPDRSGSALRGVTVPVSWSKHTELRSVGTHPRGGVKRILKARKSAHVVDS